MLAVKGGWWGNPSTAWGLWKGCCGCLRQGWAGSVISDWAVVQLLGCNRHIFDCWVHCMWPVFASLVHVGFFLSRGFVECSARLTLG
jgi:hypothetical protein